MPKKEVFGVGRLVKNQGPEAYNFQLGYLFKNNISLDARYTHLKACIIHKT